MRTLVQVPQWTQITLKGDACCIPAGETLHGSVRLVRVDTFLRDNAWKNFGDFEVKKTTRFVAWVLGKALQDGTFVDQPEAIRLHSCGTYDGITIEVCDMDHIPILPHSPFFHCIMTKKSDLVLKLIFVGPAIFHPMRVSTNVPIGPLPTPKNRTLVATFPTTKDFCP